jgi:hypothetical protein
MTEASKTYSQYVVKEYFHPAKLFSLSIFGKKTGFTILCYFSIRSRNGDGPPSVLAPAARAAVSPIRELHMKISR